MARMTCLYLWRTMRLFHDLPLASSAEEGVRGWGLHFFDLEVIQFDGGFAVEERDQHRQLVAFGMHLAHLPNEISEGTFDDVDRLADLELGNNGGRFFAGFGGLLHLPEDLLDLMLLQRNRL